MALESCPFPVFLLRLCEKPVSGRDKRLKNLSDKPQHYIRNWQGIWRCVLTGGTLTRHISYPNSLVPISNVVVCLKDSGSIASWRCNFLVYQRLAEAIGNPESYLLSFRQKTQIQIMKPNYPKCLQCLIQIGTDLEKQTNFKWIWQILITVGQMFGEK